MLCFLPFMIVRQLADWDISFRFETFGKIMQSYQINITENNPKSYCLFRFLLRLFRPFLKLPHIKLSPP